MSIFFNCGRLSRCALMKVGRFTKEGSNYAKFPAIKDYFNKKCKDIGENMVAVSVIGSRVNYQTCTTQLGIGWRVLNSRNKNCYKVKFIMSSFSGHMFRTCYSLRNVGCCGIITRSFSNSQKSFKQRNRTTAMYVIALVTFVLGGSYAAVPLYRIFCQASGLGGTVQETVASEKIKNMKARKERLLTIKFNADKSASMRWSFRPLQNEVKVYPGETALAFYTAKNPTDVPVTGISTYNVIPFEAGLYFNKIQCFCFEEQRLNPREQVDMPVFFYIDPEFSEDPALYKTDTIILSYTFFEAKEAEDLGIQREA